MSARIVEWESGTENLGRAVVALGVFDGVHLGHQTLIRDAVERAERLGVMSCVMTFDRDPDQVLTPDRAAPQLLTLEDKLEAMGELGVDTIVVVGFCRLIAELSPERFVSDVLCEALQPVEVCVGHDFRFGRFASGTVATLQKRGEEHGFSVVAEALVEVAGEPVTSTRIRNTVAAGDVETARELLGRPHRVHGTVVHGRRAGHHLGTPTANVTPIKHSAVPADGVYAGNAVVRGGRWVAGISVGTPPTFPEARDYLEAHLLDFDDDIYGEHIVLEFVERLRPQRAFASEADLTGAVRDDLRDVARLMEPHRG